MDYKKIRDRKYCLVLYPDDPSHVDCYNKLQISGYNYASILHDRDYDENGELKKPHWHIVIKFTNAVWLEPLSRELGIAVNYIEPARSLDNALLYLVHYGYEDKFQYELDNVIGTLKTRLASLLNDTDESTRALNIYDIIRNSPGIVTYTEVFEKAAKAGLYGDFRRLGVGVMYLINDHNSEIYDNIYPKCDSYETQRFSEYQRFTGSKRNWKDME